ncbi:MAG: 6-bladed beta-propeller [Prolixibacteraceae bacterium]|nr:6-bladed beta-propeller [Prolixibacteraceae bacterium]
MKNYIFTITSFVLCFIGCTSNKDQRPERVGVAKSTNIVKAERPYQIKLPEKGVDTLKVSSFANSIRYVLLETNSNTFLKRIDKLRMNDSIIAISDMTKLLLFKTDGTFLRQIGIRGKGPGEYNYITGFEIISDTIYLASSNKRTILKYTLTGKFCEEADIDRIMAYFSKNKEGELVWYNPFNGEVYFLNRALGISDTLRVEENVSLDRQNYVVKDQFNTYFQVSKGKLLFTNYMSDTIWSLTHTKKEAEFVFNLKDKLLPWKKQIEYSGGDFERYEREASPYQRINVLAFPDYLLVTQRSWSDRSDGLHSIYIHNFNDKSTTKSNSPYVYDDLIGKINLRVRGSISNETAFITYISPIELQESIAAMNINGSEENVQQEVWKKRMAQVKFDANPILVIMTLNDK